MKHQTVYVPVNSMIGDLILVDTSNATYREEWDTLTGVKPIENVNILTDSELLELKKKWCNEAWDESEQKAIDNWDGCPDSLVSFDFKSMRKDKETYLNNLNL